MFVKNILTSKHFLITLFLLFPGYYVKSSASAEFEYAQQFKEYSSYEEVRNFLTDDLLQGLHPIDFGGINNRGQYVTDMSLGDANSCVDPGSASPVISKAWYYMPAYIVYELSNPSDISEIRLTGVVAEGKDVLGDSKASATTWGDISLGCLYKTNPGGMVPVRYAENAIEVMFESQDIWTPVVCGQVFSGIRQNEKGFWQGSWKFAKPLRNVKKIKFVSGPVSMWSSYGLLTRLVEADVIGKKSSTSVHKQFEFIPFNGDVFNTYGFVTQDKNIGLTLNYSASGFEVKFKSKRCRLRFRSPSKSEYWIKIDNNADLKYEISPIIDLSADIVANTNDIHTLKVLKKTEPDSGVDNFLGLELDLNGKLLSGKTNSILRKKILFLGDSITVGLQSPKSGYTDVASSYAGILGSKFNADIRIIAQSGVGVYKGWRHVTFLPELKRVLAQNESGDTWEPDLILFNLGTNDFSRGVSNEDYRKTMEELICHVNGYYKNSTIIVMVPWTYGCYPEVLRSIVSEVSGKIKAPIHYVPTDPKTWVCQECMSDNTHPNLKGHKYAADKLHGIIAKIMNW